MSGVGEGGEGARAGERSRKGTAHVGDAAETWRVLGAQVRRGGERAEAAGPRSIVLSSLGNAC